MPENADREQDGDNLDVGSELSGFHLYLSLVNCNHEHKVAVYCKCGVGPSNPLHFDSCQNMGNRKQPPFDARRKGSTTGRLLVFRLRG